jgi:hypothetical protein
LKGKPSEVKDDHIPAGDSPKKRPNVIGIQGFSDSKQDYPESPMRLKKKGLDKLKI